MSDNRARIRTPSPPTAFWNITPRETMPAPGHVHVWRGMVDITPARLQVYRDVLSPDEQARAQRLPTPAHRQRVTAARGILRHILGRYLHTPPEALRFGLGPHGKPFLQSPTSPALYFNMAHSCQYAVYAVSLDFAVGIDLEGDRTRMDVRRLAERLCGPEELAAFRQLPEAEQHAAILACWTRKEAVVKAEGRGLALPVKHVTVSMATDEPPRILRVRGVDAAARWTLMDIPLDAGFHGALVVAGQPRVVRGWDYDESAESRAVQRA